MTPQEFKAWRGRMGLTMQEAAGLLAISKSSIELYERGARRDDGRPVEIPRHISMLASLLELSQRGYRVIVIKGDGSGYRNYDGVVVYADSPEDAVKQVLPEENLVRADQGYNERAMVYPMSLSRETAHFYPA